MIRQEQRTNVQYALGEISFQFLPFYFGKCLPIQFLHQRKQIMHCLLIHCACMIAYSLVDVIFVLAIELPFHSSPRLKLFYLKPKETTVLWTLVIMVLQRYRTLSNNITLNSLHGCRLYWVEPSKFLVLIFLQVNLFH